MTTPTAPVIDPSDLGTYLGIDVTEPGVTPRIAYIIRLAQNLCEAIASPLPAGADSVVVDVVTRAFGNPFNTDGDTTGPFTVNWGAVSGGLWLTNQNKATLRSLAGQGGVFTIDVMPATAGQNLPPWDYGYYTPGWGGWL